MTKQVSLKCRSGDIIKAHISPEVIFRRALVLASSRDDVTVEKILSYPVGPIPSSVFHDDGTMRKTCKADLAHLLEAEASASMHTILPFNHEVTAIIRDGMALFQSLNIKQCKTFGDLASVYVTQQLSCFESAFLVIDVFDRYDIQNSIKSAERNRRSKSNAVPRIFQIIESRVISDWKRFLSSGVNKQALIRFIGEYILAFY